MKVLVTGDITIDLNLALFTKDKSSPDMPWNPKDSARLFPSFGGAMMLADLIGEISNHDSKNLSDWHVHPILKLEKGALPTLGSDKYHTAYSSWSPRETSDKSIEVGPETPWRMQEFLGLNTADSATIWTGQELDEESNNEPNYDLIVIDDANLGFRENACNVWPEAIGFESTCSPWVIIKMTNPIAKGDLWDHLVKRHAAKLILITTINDLRQSQVLISRELSWERTVEDIFYAFQSSPEFSSLFHSAYIIVLVPNAGALLLTKSASTAKEEVRTRCDLYFSPGVIEGEWEQQYPGGMLGYTTCLAAGIARQIMLSPQKPNVGKGIEAGLRGMRKLHIEGYKLKRGGDRSESLYFPCDQVSNEIIAITDKTEFAHIQIDTSLLKSVGLDLEDPARNWSILGMTHTAGSVELAMKIAQRGVDESLENVPIASFGAMSTVDRGEMENLRTIGNLITEYCRQPSHKNPLSLGVFGAPGSGKSFGITQLALSLLPGEIKDITFNLSQFNDPLELHEALHQVRDLRLSGFMPLVFWDEFDTTLNGQPFGWLRHFLAPMQDSTFLEGQISHPIGPSIFVFAGGTSETLMKFDRPEDDGFNGAKGPDFVSRLKGYLEVRGPNQIEADNDRGETGEVHDPNYMMRRAILLRSILMKNAPHFFEIVDGKRNLNIDNGILRAFLEVRRYRHGARSMEAIVLMSMRSRRNRYERSMLPPMEQLDLHVETGRDFMRILRDSYT